jgi:predicted aspartyl protease
MGTFSVTIELSAINGDRRETLEALVDTETMYDFIPRPVLERLGVAVAKQFPFQLANGERVFYDVGRAAVRIEDSEAFTLVVFGELDAMPRLGSYTLTGLGLSVDPANRQLIPFEPLMMR